VSRAVLMTLSVIYDESEDQKLQSEWLYWLIEAGPYAYILTGDVLIIFLIDLLIQVREKYELGHFISWLLTRFGKFFMAIGMILVFLAYVIPGLILVIKPLEFDMNLIIR
jgi:hypothetical protein